MENTKVNFEVLNIEKANKENFVVASVKFNNSNTVYNYVRKFYEKGLNKVIVIDGCYVYFNRFSYQVERIEKKYETQGYKKTKSGVSEKIAEEVIPEEVTEITPNNPMEVISKVNLNEEIHHEKYETIKTCLECNIPVYLAGPAGSGKNHTVEQIAKELGWNFYFSNSVQQEYKLTGFIDAGGEYHDTEFYKACTDDSDCIFFLDEMDASIPDVLVLLNAAIANGYFEFPNGRVNFNHVHFVAAGNTVGTGADDMYTGRMVLDQATLDRFAIIDFDYSLNIELAITKNNTDLVEFIHQLRDEAKNKGIRATFSYRCMTMITKLEKAGMELSVAMTISIFKGMDKDTINTFSPVCINKYTSALKEIQNAA